MNLNGVNPALLEIAITIYPSLEHLPHSIQNEAAQFSSVHHERFLQEKAAERVSQVVKELAEKFFVDLAHIGIVFDTEEKVQTHSRTLTFILNKTHSYKGLYSQNEVISILRELIYKNPSPNSFWGWWDYYWNIFTEESTQQRSINHDNNDLLSSLWENNALYNRNGTNGGMLH